MEKSATSGADIESIRKRAAEYLPAERLGVIREAYEVAAECHEGQLRGRGGGRGIRKADEPGQGARAVNFVRLGGRKK